MLLSVALVGALVSEAAAAPTIRFKGGGLDRFKFHGRVALEPPSQGGPVDPLTSGFTVELLNPDGTLYLASLLPGDLQPIGGGRYQFRDEGAREGEGTRNGLCQIITRFRNYSGVWYYTVRIMAFTDLSSATVPLMTVLFKEVGGEYGVTAEWVSTSYGWRLPLSRF